MEKMIGTVTGSIIGKAIYGKVQPKTSKAGKEYEEYKIGVKLPSGCTVFISNNIWEATRSNPKMTQRLSDLEDIMTKVASNEDVYVRLSLKPDKTTGVNKFGRFRTFLNKENKLSLLGEGFVDIVDHILENDKVKLIFTNSKHEEYDVDFDKSEQPIIIKGYVSEINNDCTKIVVVDGEEQFPAQWNLTVPDHIGKQLVIGQGYAFKVIFVKGEMIKHEDTTSKEEEFDFSADFSIESLSNRKKTEFGSDELKVIAGGLLKGQSIKINSSSSFDRSSDEEELPF